MRNKFSLAVVSTVISSTLTSFYAIMISGGLSRTDTIAYQEAMMDLLYPQTLDLTDTGNATAAMDFLIPEAYTNITQEDRFSACLLVMDDNHRLSEWIAYHYHTINLRNLIVTTDPNSRSNPKNILDKWRPYFDTIELWNDTHQHMQFYHDPKKSNWWNHRLRQPYFYKQCSKRLYSLGKEWMGIFDQDEYVRFHPSRVHTEVLKQPGSVVTFLKESRAKLDPQHRTVRLLHPKRKDDQKFLWRYERDDCITLGRVDFISTERVENETKGPYPSFVDEMKFETLRWNRRRKSIFKASKVLFNVSKYIKEIEKPSTKVTIHHGPKPNNPSDGFRGCEKKAMYDRHLFINHYIGSFEYFMYRDDGRGDERRRKEFEKKNVGDPGEIVTDNDATYWIFGFADQMGEDQARYLLEDVGYLEPLPSNPSMRVE